MNSVEEAVHRRLLAEAAIEAPAAGHLAKLVRRADPLLPANEVAEAVERLQARVGGLGPLQALFADTEVTDILVNGPGPVWVERSGCLERTDVVIDEATLAVVIERILAPLGRRVDPVSPVADARLPDGSRVHVVVPPLAVDGPCLTIRRFATRTLPIEAMATPEVAGLLRWAVEARVNVVVSGATGSGKTTLLNALGGCLGPRERVVTIEEAAELRLAAPHVVRLETRPASIEGVGAISARELVRNALRMRPDRVVIGEVRGPEALDMVQAMNTGHHGSLSTIHANGPEDALRRLETLVLLADAGLPLDAVRDHLASAIDLVVHLDRPDGRRQVVEVAEVVGPSMGARTRTVVRHGRLVAPLTRPARLASAGEAPAP